jgi:Fe-S cluster biogenesis protein NfuA
MPGSHDDRELRKRMERMDSLLREVERFADPEARARTREIVQAILDLHGAGLERALEAIAAAGAPGLAMIDALARDDLVGSLLLLYGLHPLDVETRVRQALDRVAPHLRSHGARAELLGVVGGVVRVRVTSAAASSLIVKQAVEEAVYDKAPDVAGVEVEGVTRVQPAEDGRALVALPLVRG